MNLFRVRIFRLSIVAVGLAAWLAISNHCALAAFESAGKMPMAGCHGMAQPDHSPAKNDHKSSIECCQTLRSTLLTSSQDLSAHDGLSFSIHDYPVSILSATEEARLARSLEWDTGPPGADTFAESVLQRSILAHAPPILA